MKKTVKRFAALALALSLTLSLSGCGGHSDNVVFDLIYSVKEVWGQVTGFGSDLDIDLPDLNGGSYDAEGQKPDGKPEPKPEYQVPETLQELVDRVAVEEDQQVDYDRDLYTSSYQSYECDKDHECEHGYSSIRTYSFYECEWYNWDTGVYIDPYTNLPVESIKKTDYDHIIPLAYADRHGANAWTEEQKKGYADDPTVGVCVNSSDNRSKGDKGPSEWLPDENQQDYCYTWLVLADVYDLSITPEDMDTILQVLDGVDVNSLSLINEYQ